MSLFVKNGVRSYVAYNPGRTDQQITFSEGKVITVAAVSSLRSGAMARPTGLASPLRSRTGRPTMASAVGQLGLRRFNLDQSSILPKSFRNGLQSPTFLQELAQRGERAKPAGSALLAP